MRALAPEVLLSRPVQTFSAACLAPDRRLSTPTVGSGAAFVTRTTTANFTALAGRGPHCCSVRDGMLDELSVKKLMQEATARAAIPFPPKNAPRIV